MYQQGTIMGLDSSRYLPRIMDKILADKLRYMGAVHVEGPKGCGKTRTGKQHSKSSILIADSDERHQNKLLAQTNPGLVLKGEFPRLIDEWQEVPELWDGVRNNVDRIGDKGLFILTSSATPNDKNIIHSGVGRITTVKMRHMSLFESKDSSGLVSLKDLFDGNFEGLLTGDVCLKHLIQLTVRGGWPGSLNISIEGASGIPKDYLKSMVRNELRKTDDVDRNQSKLWKVLKALARNESMLTSKKDLMDDAGVSAPTLDSYLAALTRLHIIENLKPFNPGLRSKGRVGKTEKRYFTDPSLAIAASNMSPESLLGDLRIYERMFESMCVRDLTIYAETFEGKMYHYRDKKNYEIDAVIELRDGRWAAFDIRLGFNYIDKAAENLLKVCGYISSFSRAGSPEFMCVICGMSKAAYRRKDGVYVIPITALKD